MFFQKIKNIWKKKVLSISYKANPDASHEVKFSVSPAYDLEGFENTFQKYAANNIKTIGNLSPAETFTGLIAASLYFFHREKYLAAARYAETALSNEPNDYNLRIWLIQVYGNYIGRTDSSKKQIAIDMCTEAIKLEQNNYKAHLCKAIYTSHIKTPNESIPLYLEVKKLMESQNLTILSDYGQLCSFLGTQYLQASNHKDKKQAEVLFRQAIHILQSHNDNNSKSWLDHTKKCLGELVVNS